MKTAMEISESVSIELELTLLIETTQKLEHELEQAARVAELK